MGRFTFLESIGEGDMGRVYAAGDALLERKVAAKVLLEGEDREARVAHLRAGACALAVLSRRDRKDRCRGSGEIAAALVEARNR